MRSHSRRSERAEPQDRRHAPRQGQFAVRLRKAGHQRDSPGPGGGPAGERSAPILVRRAHPPSARPPAVAHRSDTRRPGAGGAGGQGYVFRPPPASASIQRLALADVRPSGVPAGVYSWPLAVSSVITGKPAGDGRPAPADSQRALRTVCGAPHRLRARPPCSATTSGAGSVASGRHRGTDTTPGSSSSRPSKKDVISSTVRRLYGTAPLSL